MMNDIGKCMGIYFYYDYHLSSYEFLLPYNNLQNKKASIKEAF